MAVENQQHVVLLNPHFLSVECVCGLSFGAKGKYEEVHASRVLRDKGSAYVVDNDYVVFYIFRIPPRLSVLQLAAFYIIMVHQCLYFSQNYNKYSNKDNKKEKKTIKLKIKIEFSKFN
jgi:hypothetical protein